MKIWNSYGSEHSNNLVMVGSFKSSNDAKEVKELIDELTNRLRDKVDVGDASTRYSKDIMDILYDVKLYGLLPHELDQLFYDAAIEVDNNKIILKTEEYDVSAFLKLFVDKGAKVEVYSAHDYPDEEHGQGK